MTKCTIRHTCFGNILTPIYAARRNGHLEVVKFLYEHGAGADNYATIKDGATPIHAACGNGHLEVVNFCAILELTLKPTTSVDARPSYLSRQEAAWKSCNNFCHVGLMSTQMIDNLTSWLTCVT